jgi:membrane protease YdiL (CAAX protease family)
VPTAAGHLDRSRARPAVVLPAVVLLLVAANLLNNWLVPRAYVATCVAAAGAALLLARWDGCSWSELGLGRASLLPGLRWSLALAAVVLLGYAAAAWLPPARPAFLDARVAGLSGGEVLLRCLVRIPVGTALLEEIGFRGVLYAMLARRHGLRAAVLVSSLLFGLWHVLPSLGLHLDNAAVGGLVGPGRLGAAVSVAGAVVGTALAGVVFCELRRRSGSLLAPFVLHWATGAFALVFAWRLTAAAG